MCVCGQPHNYCASKIVIFRFSKKRSSPCLGASYGKGAFRKYAITTRMHLKKTRYFQIRTTISTNVKENETKNLQTEWEKFQKSTKIPKVSTPSTPSIPQKIEKSRKIPKVSTPSTPSGWEKYGKSRKTPNVSTPSTPSGWGKSGRLGKIPNVKENPKNAIFLWFSQISEMSQKNRGSRPDSAY